MDAAALWHRYRDWLYYDAGLRIYLDISRMQFDAAFVQQMTPRFEKAFKDMAALEQGAIANPDEDRMVGHYWLRDPDLAPTPELRQSIIDTLVDIEQFASQIRTSVIYPPGQERFTDILSIGIGGSALGPQFVAQALGPDFPPLAIHFIDNTDPEGIDRILARLDDRLSTTIVLVISKSGGTPETRNGMIEVRTRFEQKGLHFPRQAVAITGVDSKLDVLAKQEGWLATFPMHDWVGGRTSELSAVGLLPAALQGIDIRSILGGAKAMDALTRVPRLRDNPAALLALAWYHAGNGKGEKDMVILPYKDSLLLFSRYLQQLVMESLGKEKDLDGNVVYQGIAVYGNKGSTDQHAYVQQLREGVPSFFVTFIEVLKDRDGKSPDVESDVTAGDYLFGLLQGTRRALFEKDRESITITIPEVSAHMVGALIAFYERAVGLYASLVNVNAYHQPGVEAGKKAAASVLELQRQVVRTLQQADRPLSLEELAAQTQHSDDIEIIYTLLRHLHANQRGVTIQGDPGSPLDLTVTAP
ncbi:Glucose-6-phosphate isomerase [Halomicronema hongdechloris C2206]|uniref:Glucose-6-phosphate isomerase n=1 Tax=Halomicronema hongdechloris C2206 TaxID=1641165 RepID=A0A1Z3HJB8_9CYAN|nr:glucose-6-phosphate isomerase [Halomicronema hongdechloris]ASC70207.1 Glucose-6-phosphate isomerase [Halomicronema hongdechloris C2206]